MSRNYKVEEKSALDAKFAAQKIAFAPMMFHAAKSLRDLGILKYLFENKKGAITDIAKACSISEYGATVLLEAGLSLEMVSLQEDNFTLTKVGYYVEMDEMTNKNMDFVNDVNYEGISSLTESIKTGTPQGLKSLGAWSTIYEGLQYLPEPIKTSWLDFDHFYSDRAFPIALPLIFALKPKMFLDVGGNTGKFSIACTKFDSDVKVTILDHPGQVDMALANIKANNVEDRVNAIGLDILDHSLDFPSGYDVVWMSQFLDCFSEKDIVLILKRGAKALVEGGYLYILETYWDQQKYPASTYGLHATSLYFTALANGCSRMYHILDMEKMLTEAGLKIDAKFDNIGMGHTLLRCKVVK